MNAEIEILEVSPRDGLQNEKTILPTEDKVELVERAVRAGARRIEVTSFVNPARVPQMADADEVMAALPRHEGVRYAGLVMNRRGLDRALAWNVDEIDVVVVATDTFCQRNQGMSTAQACETAAELVAEARAAGIFSTITIGASFGCPFEGEVPDDRLREVVQRVVDAGPDELALADTIGVAVPSDVKARIGLARELAGPDMPLRLHLHDTRHTGVANAVAAVESGVAHPGRQHRRSRRMSLRPQRDRQRRHRGPRLPLRPDGHRPRPRPGLDHGDSGMAGRAVGQAATGGVAASRQLSRLTAVTVRRRSTYSSTSIGVVSRPNPFTM